MDSEFALLGGGVVKQHRSAADGRGRTGSAWRFHMVSERKAAHENVDAALLITERAPGISVFRLQAKI